MKKKANRNKGLQDKGIIYEFQKAVAGIFVILMLGFFPLYYQNAYYNIMEAKKYFFVFCALGLTVLILALILLEGLENLRKRNSLKEKFFIIPKDCKSYLRKISIASWFAGVFIIAVILSAILSVDFIESFRGTDGRQLGAVIFLFCICTYAILGKYLQPGIWMAWIILVANGILFGILIFQFWGKDILHMWDEIPSSIDMMYLTTIGNINACSSYFCMILPVGMVLYYCSETVFSRLIYGIFLVMGFYASYATNTDSWILGIGVAFLAMFWFSMKAHHDMERFLELCGLFWISSLALKLSITIGNNITSSFLIQRFQGLRLQNLMIHKYTLLVEAVLLVLCMCLIKNAEKKIWEIPYQKIRNMIFFFLAIIGVIGAVMVIIVNCFQNEVMGDSLQWMNCLKLKDEFGSGRGAIWKHTIWVWMRLPLWRKFFGYGVNCFHQFYYSQGAELVQGAVRWIDPHNEILYFLSTTGIFGFIGYAGLLVSTAISSGKMSRRYPVMMMGTVMICSYLACSMVNSPTTFIIPTFFLYLGILKSMERHYKEKDLEIEKRV